jgi:hypothetical protein
MEVYLIQVRNQASKYQEKLAQETSRLFSQEDLNVVQAENESPQTSLNSKETEVAAKTTEARIANAFAMSQ